MGFSRALDNNWLADMIEVFEGITNNKEEKGGYFVRNGPVRVVDLWSRILIDPAVVTTDGVVLDLFRPLTTVFDLQAQPKFEFNQPTSNGTHLGLLTAAFDIDTSAIALEVEVNPIMQAMSSAFLRMELQNAIVIGPVRVGECLAGSQAQRISEGTVAGEIAGNPYWDRPIHSFGEPVYIEPDTTTSTTLTVEGVAIAAAASAAFEFRTNFKALVAQGAFNGKTPGGL